MNSCKGAGYGPEERWTGDLTSLAVVAEKEEPRVKIQYSIEYFVYHFKMSLKATPV